MNRAMFLGSLVGASIFACLLLMTFIGQGLLKDFARDYLNRRIEPGVTSSVAVIEREVLPKLEADLALKVAAEIARYRQDPLLFIDDLTAGRRAAVETPTSGRMATAVETLKTKARKVRSLTQVITDHFRAVFEHLVLDLRLFAVSNLIGFAVVAWLTHRLPVRSRRLQIQAFILFLATGYALSVYIKQDWFFNLLLDRHMGVLYPLLILGTCLDLWRRWRRGQFRARATSLVNEMVLG